MHAFASGLPRRIRTCAAAAIAVAVLLAGAFVLRALVVTRRSSPPTVSLSARSEEVVAASPFQITLWADSPLVHNPSNIDIDARGRVWVAECVNYRNWQNRQSESPTALHQEQGDRIVILEDSDGDGRADQSKVFVQDPELVAPMGICLYGNRVIVSCSPHVLVFTDEDGDDRADRKERLLTGFGGFDHDHGVHTVVPGPDGNLYLVTGNAGPHHVTDAFGWTLRSGGVDPWGRNGKFDSSVPVSDDGRVYVNGLALRFRPDGSALSVFAHNFRNPYEIAVDSFGDVWHSDNDDTVGCRIAWTMEGANLGFRSADGRRKWQDDRRPGQSTPAAHWHQDDPGVLPAGEIYGAGAPTGLIRYEGDAFGPDFRGCLLFCEAGHGCVYQCQPIPNGAGFQYRLKRLVWPRPVDAGDVDPDANVSASTWFRPTDAAIAPNGDVFISDWYDSYVGGHRVTDLAAEGRIFRLSLPNEPRGANGAAVTEPVVILSTIDGCLEAFRSPSPHLRALARDGLLADAEKSVEPVTPLLHDENPFIRARAIWLLSELDPEWIDATAELADDGDPRIRITVLRAMNAAGVRVEELAARFLKDPSPAVRRELAVALRGLPLETIRPYLLELAAGFDGQDRTYLEAIGLAAEPYADALYPDLKMRLGDEPRNWSPAFAELVWRLHPTSALPDLAAHCRKSGQSLAERRRTIDAIAFIGNQDALRALQSLLESWKKDDAAKREETAELAEYTSWWVSRLTEDLSEQQENASEPPPAISMSSSPATPVAVDRNRIDQIVSLPGDAKRGRALFFGDRAACGKCHQWQGAGGGLGPDLSFAKRKFGPRELAEAILYPDASILTGYETWSIVDREGRIHTGLLVSTGGAVTIRSAEGKLVRIRRHDIEELIRQPISLMPQKIGKVLTTQEIADLMEFIKRGP